jgi:ubiquinone/menaquinone biosynthesis C-methylase UbiE
MQRISLDVCGSYGGGMTTGAISRDQAERLRRFERESHDALAESYNDFFTAVTALAISPLLKAIRLQPGHRLLDGAAGPGHLAATAAKRHARCTGIDLSPKMVALASRLYPDLQFREADIEHLPFPENSFDAVAGAFVLGHLPDPQAAVAECMRVLRPDCWMAFSWWDDPARQRIQGLFRETITEAKVQAPPDIPQNHNVLRFSESGAFLQLLESAGLADTAVEDHATTFTFADIETVWQGGLGSFVLTGAAIRRQSEAEQRKLRDIFERRANTYKTAGGVTLPIAFKVGFGRKKSAQS